jgi:hypothetical protein
MNSKQRKQYRKMAQQSAIDLIKNVGGAELGDAYNTLLQDLRKETLRNDKLQSQNQFLTDENERLLEDLADLQSGNTATAKLIAEMREHLELYQKPLEALDLLGTQKAFCEEHGITFRTFEVRDITFHTWSAETTESSYDYLTSAEAVAMALSHLGMKKQLQSIANIF